MPKTVIYTCENCGQEIGATDRFCPHCGAEIIDAEVEGEAVSYDPHDSTNDQAALNSRPRKSRLAAGLLAIFLGTLGVHNFYLGYTNRGLAQLLLTIVGSWFTCGLTAYLGTCRRH